MTITKATKVSARNWSLEKFTASVKANCKRLGVPFLSSRVKKAYDENVSVMDTVAIMRGGNKPASGNGNGKKKLKKAA